MVVSTAFAALLDSLFEDGAVDVDFLTNNDGKQLVYSGNASLRPDAELLGAGRVRVCWRCGLASITWA